jgi:hypothetical protein
MFEQGLSWAAGVSGRGPPVQHLYQTTVRQGSAGIDGCAEKSEIAQIRWSDVYFGVCSAAIAEEALTNSALAVGNLVTQGTVALLIGANGENAVDVAATGRQSETWEVKWCLSDHIRRRLDLAGVLQSVRNSMNERSQETS